MRFPLFLFALLITPAVLAQAPDPAPSTPVETVDLVPFEPTREDAVLEGFIDGAVAAHMREHDTPAVSVSVVRNGRTVFAKGYGFADIESGRMATGDQTLFRIGSVSKAFIWVSIMMLEERGLVDLDADVNRYLKGVTIPEAFGAPVTLNDLMAHRAGFEDTLAVFTHSDEDGITLTDALNEDMPARVYPPGARTNYSNWGAALSAKIVEDVTGVSYETFVQERIFTPLGMDRTTIKAPSKMPPELRNDLATGYKYEDGAPKATDYMQIGHYAPAGAIASTADDMARWMLFLLGEGDGPKLLSDAALTAMRERAFSDRAEGADVAHGLITKTIDGYETFGHGGATETFFSNLVIVPGLDLGVYVSQNATDDRTLVYDLAALAIDHVTEDGMGPAITGGDANADLSAYAGTYLHNRRSFTTFEKLFAISSVAEIAATDDGALIVTTSEKSTRYTPVPGVEDTFENRYGGRIVFGRNEKGEVTTLSDWSGVHSLDRPGFLENPMFLDIALGLAFAFSLTTIAGAWRRQGKGAAPSKIAFGINVLDLVMAGAFFAFVGVVVAVTVLMSSAGANDLQGYPPAPIVWLRMIALLVFFLSALGVASLAPAWMKSGMSIWRKAHHTLFVLSMAFLAVILVVWKVVFSATA